MIPSIAIRLAALTEKIARRITKRVWKLVEEASSITLDLFDVHGRRVRTLLDSERQGPGIGRVPLSYVLKRAQTLRFEPIARAGCLARPNGRAVLRLGTNKKVLHRFRDALRWGNQAA